MKEQAEKTYKIKAEIHQIEEENKLNPVCEFIRLLIFAWANKCFRISIYFFAEIFLLIKVII